MDIFHSSHALRWRYKIGHPQGIIQVGLVFGQLICRDGQIEVGIAALEHSRQVFEKLGQMDEAKQGEAMIERFSGS